MNEINDFTGVNETTIVYIMSDTPAGTTLHVSIIYLMYISYVKLIVTLVFIVRTYIQDIVLSLILDNLNLEYKVEL